MHPLLEGALRYRWTTILLSLLLVALLSAGAGRLVFKNDYRIFFSADNPQLQAFERMQRAFAKSDNLIFILVPEDGEVFSKKTLAAVHWLTEQAWQTPYSSRVDSLTNFQHTYGEEDDLIVEDLVLDPELLDEAELERIRKIVFAEPLLVRRLVAPDGDVTAVNVTLQMPGIDETREVPEVMNFARTLKAEFEQRHPDIRVMLSGIAVMANAFSESAKKDALTLIPLMFGVIVLLTGALNRSLSGMLATLLVIAASITSALGLWGWAGQYLSSPSASAPTVIMTVAVADCVHILASYRQALQQGLAKQAALVRSLSINLKPVLLTSITTAIGFLSLNFSDSPPFRDLGNIVAAGVLAACALSLTLFPAILALAPAPRVSQQARQTPARTMNALADWVIRHQRAIMTGSLLAVILCALMLPLNQLNDNFVEYFDRTIPFRQATDFANERLSGMALMEVELDSGRPQGINDPEFLQKVDAFATWARSLPETHNVQTLTDTLKRLNMNLHGDDPAWYRLPEERDLTAQYLLLYEMSLPYGLDLNNQINVDKSALRLTLTFRNMSSQEQLAVERRILDWLARNAPEIRASVSGPPLMFSHIGQRNIRSMLTGTLVALILISVLMAVALRSLRYGVISLVPNLVPMVMAFGLWGLLVGEVGLGLSIVSGMTLGIVVDDTVHFLTKYLHARKEGMDTEAAMRYAFNTVGRAMWITTLVLVAGFFVLTGSSFLPNAQMGLLTAVTIAIALIMDFLLLPTLLLRLDHNRTHKETAP